ncbi:GtrA family protein [Devosia sp.]|uniref:GtrA family protein n=1 Tax=Devosia sp. TaxID=1871048 RepID=UPI0032652D66
MLDKLKVLSQHQVLRFLLLGGFAAAVNWLVRFPLSATMPIGAAVVLAYLIGMSAGFPLYRRFVFPGSSRPVMQQSLIFLAVNAVGALVVLGLTYLFLAGQSGFAYPEFAKEGLAHGFAIGLGAVVNFFGHKSLTFSLEVGKRPLTSH